jgi:hypothetical protein
MIYSVDPLLANYRLPFRLVVALPPACVCHQAHRTTPRKAVARADHVSGDEPQPDTSDLGLC